MFRQLTLIPILILIVSTGFLPAASAAPPCTSITRDAGQSPASTQDPAVPALAELQSAIGSRKAKVTYPKIPSVLELHLPAATPQKVERKRELSPGVADPLLEEARRLKAFDDFMPLSDARPKALTATERNRVMQQATAEASAARDAARKTGEDAGLACRKAFLKGYIDRAYIFGGELIDVPDLVTPRWKVTSGQSRIDDAFAYTERTLAKLVRRTPIRSEGSLLPNPYPFTIPAGRFQESYYWDSYFGMLGLLDTGRLELSQMQVENFLEAVRAYGLIPNGMRDFYLSRSQPPFLSSMVRDVYEATVAEGKTPKARLKQWLEKRAFPLVRADYRNFWMDPDTRYDAATGLNHDWDALDLPRPERHAADDERKLGRTFRDVRAEAESGLDFTATFEGEGTKIAGVLLNAMLFKTETDLAWMASELGRAKEATELATAAARRKAAMEKYLWDEDRGWYENYNLRTGKRVEMLGAFTFVPLFVREASPEHAGRVEKTLAILEKKGGLMSSDQVHSTYQWDGDNGWAPLQVMAVAGLLHYGYRVDAQRIARKWVDTIAEIHSQIHSMYERVDVAQGTEAKMDPTQYPPQQGFLWTNSSFVWMLRDVLGTRLIPLH